MNERRLQRGAKWTALSLDERVAKWRRLAIGNTVAAAVVVVITWLLWAPLVAGIVTVVMAITVADIWYLVARTRKTGNPFLRAVGTPPSSE